MITQDDLVSNIDELIDSLKSQREYIEALKDLCADWALLNDKMIDNFGFDNEPLEEDNPDDMYDTVDEEGVPQT